MSTTQPAGDEVVEQLQNKWYNTLVDQLHLDTSTFQLIQASEPIGSSTKNLWNIFDTVPPASLTNVATPGEYNSFYRDYSAVVNTIIPQGGTEFRRVMGDYLDQWDTYKKNNPDQVIQNGLEKAFEEWAVINLPDDVGQKAIIAFKQMEHGVVMEAQTALYDDSYFQADGTPMWSKTIEDLESVLPQGEDMTVSFDSETASSDVEHTWAKGEANAKGLFSFFTGSAGASYDQLNKKAMSSKITVDATFKELSTFEAKPGGWYHSDALNMAYQTSDNTVWPAGQHPTWEEMFGENGDFKRATGAIVAFSGLEATITSDAKYSKEEQQEIRANTSLKFWPFVSFDASGGHTSNPKFDSSGAMTVTMNIPKGNPNLLGRNVVPMDRFLG